MASNKEKSKAARAQALKESFLSDMNARQTDSPLNAFIKEIKETETRREVFTAPADSFIPYPDEKIRLSLHEGDKRESMKESIKQDGILEPILVWLDGNKKIILAGHNRVDIAKELNIPVPYIVVDNINSKRADRIVAITNLQNRQYSEMKPSEKSRLLLAIMDSYDDSAVKERVYSDIESEFSFNKKKIIQYTRLRFLIPEFMQKLDDKKIPMFVAYELTFVPSDIQNKLFSFMVENNIDGISINTIKKLSSQDCSQWDDEFIAKSFAIVPSKVNTNITVKMKNVSNYLDESEKLKASKIITDSLAFRKSVKEIFNERSLKYDENIVLEAVKQYLKNNS